jgi:hypothetical protein
MSRLAEMNELIKEYGEEGIKLLFLFKLIKSRIKLAIQQGQPSLAVSEPALDWLCVARAHELLKTWERRTDEERH